MNVTGSWHQVMLKDGSVIPSRIIGRLRLEDIHTTNPVGVGDFVEVEWEQDQQQCIITKVLPRRNYIVRQSPRKKHELHLIAANVDQAFIVTSIIHPTIKFGFIDRFILMTEPQNIPLTIVLNKCDLYNEEAWEMVEVVRSVYEPIGYKVLPISTLSGEGLDALLPLFNDKVSFIGGQSGVGKSSLINSIEPGLGLKTEELSSFSGKGQHTTTFAEMFPLKAGGFIMDTPGIKMLSFNNLELQDVAHNFREFFTLSSSCRFPNCLHRNEPGCAVKRALEQGEVSPVRYENYLVILEEIEQQNYWERHKNM